MKVRIRSYPGWFGAYKTLANLIGDDTPRKEKIVDMYADSFVGKLHDSLARKWSDFHDKRRVNVKLDDYDTWNMDNTLGYIVLPMLKQLKETKHGSPWVELEDVPPELQLHGTSRNESMQYDMFANDEYDEAVWNAMHARWDWVLDEMIFAFDCLVGEQSEWEDQFWTGDNDFFWEDAGNGFSELKHGLNHTRLWDKEGQMAWMQRMDNGFRLFGKYYRGLWD